jgi:hypothetical protein
MSATHGTAADSASVYLYTADEVEGVHLRLEEALHEIAVGRTDLAMQLIENAAARLWVA